MRRPDFGEFRTHLLRSGVAPRNVRRAVMELTDHYDDLVDDAVATGMTPVDAELQACKELGDLEMIAAEIAARPELRGWAWQHPRLALVVYPLACIAVLPAVPLIASVAHAPTVVRWASGVLLGGVVTATMLLAMQLVITLT